MYMPKKTSLFHATYNQFLNSIVYLYMYIHWQIDAALEEGVETLKQVLSKGLTESARSFNTEQKYKHIRLQTMPVWLYERYS